MKSIRHARTALLTKTALLSVAASLVFAAAPSPATAQSRAQPYATVGDWIVEFVPAQRQRNLPAYCQVTQIFDQEVALRMVSGANLYAIDFMGLNSLKGDPKSYDLQYFFNQPNPNNTLRQAVAPFVTDHEGVGWFRIEEPINEPGSADEMMNARLITIRPTNYKDRQWQYKLDGANRALTALFDCRDEKVLGQPRRAAAPIAQMPAPNQQFIQPSQQFFNAAPPPPPPPVAQFRQVPPPPMPQFQGAPPPQQFQSAPPPRGNNQVDLCSGYANQMVANTTQALQIRCPGWPSGHLNYEGHFKWCMGKSRGDVDRAVASWSGRLQGCLASQGNRPPAPQPAALGGRDQSRHPICSSFAKNAERWDNAAKAQGCRLSNDKTERGYYDWCQGTTDAEFRQRSPVAAGHKAGREKECSAQLRRPVRL
jgi:hypothetical protein